MKIKWSKKYKEKWGYSAAKDLSINEKECLDKKCFRPHDWNHNGHLVCITNYNYGCPLEDYKQADHEAPA